MTRQRCAALLRGTPILQLVGVLVVVGLFALGCGDSSMPTQTGGDQFGGQGQGQSQEVGERDRPDGQPEMPTADRHIVVLNPTNDAFEFERGARSDNREQAEAVAEEYDITPAHTYGSALFGFAATVPERVMEELRADDRVQYIDDDEPLDLFTSPRADTTEGDEAEELQERIVDPEDLEAAGEEQPDEEEAPPEPWGVERIGADHSEHTGEGARVYVIDTGIDAPHPRLAENLGSGYAVQPCQGETCAADWDDEAGHGTPLAGIIGAQNNPDEERMGVAPDATLHAVKVFDHNGRAAYSDVAAGIDWMVGRQHESDRPVVATLGFGRVGAKHATCTADGFEYDPDEAGSEETEENGDAEEEPSPENGETGNDSDDEEGSADAESEDVRGPTGIALHEAICTATNEGVVFVAAAGNDGGDAANTIPAAFDDAVITVGAANADDERADTSNTGDVIDLVAPGTNILSTQAGGGTTGRSGTSIAAAHVAGVAAIYLSGEEDLSQDYTAFQEVRDTLRSEGEDVGWDGAYLVNLRSEVFARGSESE